jgi:hypothetical protein
MIIFISYWFLILLIRHYFIIDYWLFHYFIDIDYISCLTILRHFIIDISLFSFRHWSFTPLRLIDDYAIWLLIIIISLITPLITLRWYFITPLLLIRLLTLFHFDIDYWLLLIIFRFQPLLFSLSMTLIDIIFDAFIIIAYFHYAIIDFRHYAIIDWYYYYYYWLRHYYYWLLMILAAFIIFDIAFDIIIIDISLTLLMPFRLRWCHWWLFHWYWYFHFIDWYYWLLIR